MHDEPLRLWGSDASARPRPLLTAPPGWPVFLLVLVACGIGLWAASYPTAPFSYLIISVLALGILGLWWLMRFAVALIARNRSWTSVLAPAAVAVTILLTVLSVPLQLRLLYAKPDFEALVAELAANQPARWEPREVGGYRVSQVRRHNQNWYFVIEDSGFLDDDGLAYLPDGPPRVPDPVGEGVKVGHISGAWYWFSAGW